MIKTGKDKIDKEKTPSLVKESTCQNAQFKKEYVWQTKGIVEKTVQEHKKDINRVSDEHSVWTYEMNGEKVDILDREVDFRKRLTAEIIFFRKESKNALNKEKDTEELSEAYDRIIDKI